MSERRVARKGYDDAKVQEHLADEAVVVGELRAVVAAFNEAAKKADAELKRRRWQLQNFRQQFLEPCPTCSGPTQETVGLVCQDCGHDYGLTL